MSDSTDFVQGKDPDSFEKSSGYYSKSIAKEFAEANVSAKMTRAENPVQDNPPLRIVATNLVDDMRSKVQKSMEILEQSASKSQSLLNSLIPEAYAIETYEKKMLEVQSTYSARLHHMSLVLKAEKQTMSKDPNKG